MFTDETSKSIKIDPSGLMQVTLKAIGHDSKEHEYSGALLSDIIEEAGASLGEVFKRKTVSTYTILTAVDKYQCVYALAELDPLFSTNLVILADKADGKPLFSENGQFQVIASAETWPLDQTSCFYGS